MSTIIYDAAPFKERVKKNLAKEFQHEAIKSAQGNIGGKRDKLSAADPQWEEYRVSAEAIRKHVLENLDYYVKQFVENGTKLGYHIHFAPSEPDAVAAALEVAQAVDCDYVVKAKSLLSEEVGINQRFAEHGIQIQETDCAEAILQAAGSPPSHIVVPALHYARDKIREIFAAKLGYEGTQDPTEMTKFLRAYLRPRFMTAKIGMRGCNFAVAETGTCTLVTNEGNGRMCSTYPETLIIFLGIERIVPDLKSLDVMTQLLVPSAVGSKMTSSFTMNTGPRKEGEIDGPKDIHVIIVDNGRTRILADQKFKDILRCIHCGACMNTCPVYRHITGHAYGSIYPGPMGMVYTPLFVGYEEFGKTTNACSLCGACANVCPVKIPLNNLILEHRNIKNAQGHVGGAEKFVFNTASKFLGSRGLYGMMTSVGRVGTKILADKKTGRMSENTTWVPALKGWTSVRDMDVMQVTFREQFKERQAKGIKEEPVLADRVKKGGAQ